MCLQVPLGDEWGIKWKIKEFSTAGEKILVIAMILQKFGMKVHSIMNYFCLTVFPEFHLIHMTAQILNIFRRKFFEFFFIEHTSFNFFVHWSTLFQSLLGNICKTFEKKSKLRLIFTETDCKIALTAKSLCETYNKGRREKLVKLGLF